uniref:Uncharacterized protein LOC104245070 n=1 Tax=Nicotiana sylvestris TaxID=4096 RepID=A0A1U7Y477_NICSY|nr:PREDICTED: uncharacterized protein LOC104245070 [Nicotiana sylvestris]
MDARVRRFLRGLSLLVVNEAATTALHSDMNYGKIVGFAQATESRKLKIRAERESRSRARSTGHSGRAVPGRGPSGSDSRRPHHSGCPGGRSQQQGRDSCPKYGMFHSKTCYLDIPVCYRCRVRGHIQRDCRAPSQGMGGGFAQSSGSSAATSSVRPPTPAGHGVVRGGARGRGVSSRFYTLSGRQSAEASPDVATGILAV